MKWFPKQNTKPAKWKYEVACPTFRGFRKVGTTDLDQMARLFFYEGGPAPYYLICMKQGRILGGRKTVPERIRENRAPYIAGLQAADRAYEKGQYDITELAKYLEELLKGQLTEAP